jgi:GMP synthase-like glutamine amidotransferase
MTPARLPRLLIVDPSVIFPEDEGVGEVLGDWPGETCVLRPGLKPGDGPSPGEGYDVDGVVVMGSRASVHDDRPWLGGLGDWLDPILSGAIPIPLLGICFGHQLVAHRAGGTVGFIKEDRTEELGLRETRLDRCGLAPERDRMVVVVSHNEEVKKVPPRYRVTARRREVQVDGLEHEHLPIFSYQFHPEARRDFLVERGVPLDDVEEGVFQGMADLLCAFRRLVIEKTKRQDHRER